MNDNMSKNYLIISAILISVGLMLITSSFTQAQSSNEFTVPLSDPAKRGKLKAHLNNGSITVKGTARKDVVVKYTSVKDEDEERDDDLSGSRQGLKRI
ncbi:MAG TPA: hypothetical protein VFO54_06285, partial [Chryseosolibacter sp.]|nr:hypothetical protein [Chryseosolibacter sp.]